MYWDSRLPPARSLAELETLEITESKAGDLAMKIRALSFKWNEMEAQKAKEEARSARNEARSRNR